MSMEELETKMERLLDIYGWDLTFFLEDNDIDIVEVMLWLYHLGKFDIDDWNLDDPYEEEDGNT